MKKKIVDFFWSKNGRKIFVDFFFIGQKGKIVKCMYEFIITSDDDIVCTGNRVGITVLQTTPRSPDVMTSRMQMAAWTKIYGKMQMKIMQYRNYAALYIIMQDHL